jgi:hypothetical protein
MLHVMRARWVLGLILGVQLAGTACAPRDRALPEEFPPVRLGMPRAEVRAALSRAGADIAGDDTRMLTAVGRDRRVREESFFFYRERLAAYVLRYPGAASRGVFQRQTRRFNLTFGEPFETADNGYSLIARWRAPELGGRVLMTASVGRPEQSALTVRVEDPSVLPRLLRALGEEPAERDSL